MAFKEWMYVTVLLQKLTPYMREWMDLSDLTKEASKFDRMGGQLKRRLKVMFKIS